MSHFPRPRAPAQRGFTLVELVVVITIIAMLAGAVLPAMMSPYLHERRQQTMQEMSAIVEGILGNPSQGQWGYLSHMGTLPDNVDASGVPLGDLLLKRGSWSPGAMQRPVADQPGVWRGWSGPYVQVPTPAPTTDPWGTPYQIVKNTADPTNSQWQLRSYGPNRVPGPVGGDDDDIIYPSTTAWYASTGTLRTTWAYIRDGGLDVPQDVDPGSMVLHVPVTPAEPDGLIECDDKGSGQCEFTNVPLGLHLLKIPLPMPCGMSDCTIYRQVKVLKPLNAVEVVIPNPPDFEDLECGLANIATGGIANEDCILDRSLPPGGHLTVTISGSLGRVSGTGRCMLAPQVMNVATSGRTPPNVLLNIVHETSLPVTSQSDTPTPAFTTRTYVNTGATSVTLRPAAVLAADASTDCQFNDGKLIARRWSR